MEDQMEMTDTNFFRYAAGQPFVKRVAYYAGKQIGPKKFEESELDHVDWQMPDGRVIAGYRFKVPA